jgi:membrane protease YdiL (CAAX protease family)
VIDRRGDARLGAWLGLVGVLIALAYVGRAAEGRPPRDVVYTYDFSIAGAISYAFVLGVLLLIARGLPLRDAFALRRPTSWGRALLIAVGVFLAVYVLSGLTSLVGNPGREQGLTPAGWDGDRAVAFAASFVVIAVVAPVVEELTYRGLGFTLLERFGQTAAIVTVGVLFGLAHGLLIALPVLTAFGIGLAVLRAQTQSVVPGILLHAVFNATALIFSVAS